MWKKGRGLKAVYLKGGESTVPTYFTEKKREWTSNSLQQDWLRKLTQGNVHAKKEEIIGLC